MNPYIPGHQRFLAHARTTPDAVALEFLDQRVTYAQLEERSRRLAVLLRRHGVRRGATVGVAVQRSPQLVVALLAVLRAGGAWVPLDPSYPADRLAYMLADSGVGLLVADEVSAAALPTASVPRIDPDGAADGPLPDCPLDPGDLAYMIYTSGSTGRPKGALLTHGGLTNLCLAQEQTFAPGPDARVLQFAPASFDASVFEMAMALHAGATLVLALRDAIAPGADLAATLRERRITHVTLPPSVLATLSDGPDLPDLRMLVCAGEALPEALVRRWAPGRHMVNAYGPTEATVWATRTQVDAAGGRPTIGTAIAGAQVHVVDEALRPVPVGASGELVIGGHGVGRGYHDRPALTADRFVPDPFSPVPGARLYRSGDLVRQRPDGQLEFLGRIDHQVKLRGFRIEPDEVAAVLREHAAVRDAVVVVRDDGAGDRLVAYAVSAGSQVRELLAHLAERLPAHLVPAALVLLDALPLTPSGKIDRAALPAPDRHSGGLDVERVAPRTPTETTLVALVGELLGVREVGVEDDFFALGGHSLLAGRFAARIREELHREVPLSAFYRTPTVAAVAALVDAGGGPVLPPLTPADRTRPIPLAYPQERIWYLEQLSPGNLAYNAQASLRLRGPLDAAVLRATLTELVRRHEILRTAFHGTDAGAVQEICPPMPVDLPLTDLTGASPAEREALAEQRVAEFLVEPFDLRHPPLARWALIRHAHDDHTLVHVEHHLVHDGWSYSVFLDELGVIYAALAAQQSVPLPEPAPQYADFAAWQRAWLSGETLQRQLEHWVAELDGTSGVLALPTDRPRPPTQSFAGAALRVDLPRALCRQLRRFSREHGVTLYTTMLAGFSALLSRYSGQDDLVVGNGVANRRLASIERMLGMVVNTLPLRVDLSGEPGFAELVQRVHRMAGRAYEWQDVPLDELVRRLAPQRDLSRNPLFQVMFSFHDSAVPQPRFAGLTGTVLERHNGSAKTDLNIVVLPRDEQGAGRDARDDSAPVTLIWEYATDLFDADTMRRMVGHYQRLLDEATTRPQRPVHRLPLLSTEETAQLLGWNRTAAAYPAQGTIAGLFAEQVAARPDAVALIGDETELTYAELDERAGRLAHLLRGRGVGLDTPVGVLLERGVEMITVFLAVLKAGGGYVPLDPAYPAQRLEWMLSDSRVPVVVTRSKLRDRLRVANAVDVVVIDEEPIPPTVAPATVARPDSLAYVLYTSGSTGRPKGVMVDHRAVLRLVCGTDYLRFGPQERIAQVADASFDALTFELWGALLHGGTVCVVPADALLTPGRLGTQLRRHGVTSMFLTSALFNEVMSTHPDSFAQMANLLVGGDALNPERIRQLLRAPQRPRRLLNGYGPTETTTFAVVHDIEDLPDDAVAVPIGRPIANTTAYVLDSHLEPVPIGVPGELYLGGPGVARGYADRPGLTAQRFLPDPFAGDGSRLYRTGDLARWRADGVLDFLGRADDQVKIRGFRIEPGEIESVLLTHPQVANAAVRVADGTAGKRLSAYLVPDGAPPSTTELRQYLAERLPPHLVPALYTVLPALPLNAHGKVDRAALPAADLSRQDAVEFVAPGTPTERTVADLYTELLGVQRVGRDDDFFTLGGHSLLAMRLVTRVNQHFGREVPLRCFLRLPTVAGLAAAVTDASVDVEVPAIRPAAGRAAEQLLSQVDELSEEQVESLLAELAEDEAHR